MERLAMERLELGQMVIVTANKLPGQVRGIWTRLDGSPLYHVKYVNGVGSQIWDWISADEFTVAPAA